MANPSTSVHEGAIEGHETPDAPSPIRTWRDKDASYMVVPLEALMHFPNAEDTRKYSPVDCSICEDLASDRPKEAIWRQRSISELDASGEQGCKYCLLLSKGIRACVPEVELTDKLALENRLAKVFSEKPPNRYGVSVFQGEDDDGWEDKVVPIRSIPSGDTSSATAIDRAKEWLRNCIEQHDQCDKGEERPAPSRLIDTKPDESQDVQLIEPENLTCQYVCLSHCWGNTGAIKTTKETLHERKESIPWGTLCPTFQDAITVVRRLGLRYLWIDSLCIIQDDDDDWARESSKMATIYNQAHLTIATTRSPNHEGGCFSKLKPQFQTHKVTVPGPDDGELTLFFRQLMPHCAGLILTPEQAEEFPLLDRAWVYQERLLSPRILHFHNNELSWECAHHSACECGDDVKSSMEIYLSSFKRPKVEHASALTKTDTLAMADRWHQIVQEYSGLKMTFQKDALSALSGLARQMSEHREGEQYIVGLWEVTILVDMLWAAQSGSGRRPDKWRGPSWSWVSTTATITYVQASVFAIIELYPDIVDSNVRVMSEDRFGQAMRPTWIKIKSALFSGAIVQYVQPPSEDPEAKESWVDHYEIHAMGASLGIFTPDYNYSNAREETETAVPDGSSVGLVLMGKTDNRYLYFVLIKLSSTPVPESAVTWEFDKDGWTYVWERIGLLAVEHHLGTLDPIGQNLEVSEEEILIV
ncbi:HET-domain-containing protein [Ustulina deusta]|nr:HET-domain-containing protein [Ustulina deusta]